MFENSCQALAWVRPAGNIRLNTALGAPNGIPVSGQAFGWAGLVASHHLSSAVDALTVVATVKINYASMSRHKEYDFLDDRAVDARSRVYLDLQHQDLPDCNGLRGLRLDQLSRRRRRLLSSDGVYVGIALRVRSFDPSRITIDLDANADASFGDELVGNTGWIPTVVDLDVVSFSVVTA